MRVCFLAWHFPPDSWGGMATQNEQIVKHLSEKNIVFDVVTLSPKGNMEEKQKNLTVFRVDMKFMYGTFTITPTNFLKILKIISKTKPDILQLDWPALPFVDFALLGKIKFSLPLITNVGANLQEEARRFTPSTPLQIFYLWRSKICLHLSDRIIVDGDDIRELLVKSKIRRNKIHTIRNGIDTDMFDPFKFDQKIKNELGLADSIVIPFIGKLATHNGTYEYLKVMINLMEEYEDIRGIIIGSGPQEADLKQKVNCSEFKDKFIFVGKVNHEQMPKYIASIDIGFFPMQQIGGVSQIVPETMAMQKPVLTTNVGDIRSLVRHMENGLTVEKGNIEMMVKYLSMLIEDRVLRSKIGKKARDFIVKNWSWTRVSEEYLKIYNDVKHK